MKDKNDCGTLRIRFVCEECERVSVDGPSWCCEDCQEALDAAAEAQSWEDELAYLEEIRLS